MDDNAPGIVDHAISALNSWFGDHLARTDNALHTPMAFFRANQPVEPEADDLLSDRRVVLLVHGLGCNESLWAMPGGEPGYGERLRAHGFSPLYVRFNTGLRISKNGQAMAGLLERLVEAHPVDELVIIGHSMGGLVTRSACHLGREQAWTERVRHVVYLGSPHLGAPLEKAANVAAHVLGKTPSTATRVISGLLNTRAAGIKDLRFGNLVDEDWLEHDPDELLNNRRVPVPWLQTARHHRVAGAIAGGDGMVMPNSAKAEAHHNQPGAPEGGNVAVLSELDHLSLARHPAVYEHIERWVIDG